MCGGMRYLWEGKERTVYFPQPEPKVPVQGPRGKNLVTWGRRKQETKNTLPAGGWARSESLSQGRWEQWQPAPVAILAREYMEKNDRSYWFNPPENSAIAGIGIKSKKRARVYVVTRAASEPYQKIHDRWPCFRKPKDAVKKWWE